MRRIFYGVARRFMLIAVAAIAFSALNFTRHQEARDMKLSESDSILKPCRLQGLDQEVRCGTYQVYEDRRAKRGRRIGLNIAVLPALSDKPAPDPLFYIAGGPGQAATRAAEFVAEHFAAIRKDRDIVLVDQRGTGGSNPLTCDLWKKDPPGYFGEYFPVDSVRDCRAQLEKKADLRLYTTSIAVDDLDEVRAALGYERINIYGTSYGTFVAQSYLRRYGDRVRSIILKGVQPPDLVFPIPFAKDSQRALDLLFEDCAADEACRQAFPNLRQEFQAVLARIDRGSAKAEVPHPATGKPMRVHITRGSLGTTLRTLLQSTETSSRIPLLIHRAYSGDFAPLANMIIQVRQALSKGIYFGMQFSVFSSEWMPALDRQKVAGRTEDTFLGDYWVEQVIEACRVWPRGDLAFDSDQPVRSDIPVLLVSGFLDPATPPENGERVAKFLSNALHIIIRNGSHSYSGLAPCLDDIMTDFIRKGSVKGLDTACTDKIRRPPFVVSSE